MRFIHVIVHVFFYMISLIPLRVLYVLSDCMTFLFYHVLKYRRSIVMENLQIAFPEKSEIERKKNCERFLPKYFRRVGGDIQNAQCE